MKLLTAQFSKAFCYFALPWGFCLIIKTLSTEAFLFLNGVIQMEERERQLKTGE
jgi:hypothetical protein